MKPQEAEYYSIAPPLKEYFYTATFELDLTTGQVYTFLTSPEDIAIPCQQEEFDLNLLAEKLENGQDSSEHWMEELERIPLIRKIAAPADVMELEEIEDKIRQYCKLWTLYAKTQVYLQVWGEFSLSSSLALMFLEENCYCIVIKHPTGLC